MKLLGTTELAAFLKEQPDRAESLNAWAAEIRDRNWASPEAMARDFPHADIGQPEAVFQMGVPPAIVETLIDFRNGVLLVVGLRPAAALSTSSSNSDRSREHD